MKKIALNIAIVLSITSFVSCDKDFNSIGSNVIGQDNFEFDNKDDVTLVAYTHETGPVQTNNLPLKALGIYEDPFFGTTTASFVTQLSLPGATPPDFGFDVSVEADDFVYLYIPYSSTKTGNATGNDKNPYVLNEVYGDISKTFSLKVFENKYFLRDFEAADPSIRKKYYSNDKNLIENQIDPGSPLNFTDVPSESTEFQFSSEEILVFKTNSSGQFLDIDGNVTTDETKKVIEDRLAPGMRIKLKGIRFEDEVLKTSTSNLVSNSVFREHFRGLYFQVEANSGAAAITFLDFSNASVEIQYHSKDTETATTATKKNIKLTLTGNSVSFFDNNFSPAYSSALSTSNPITGDENLYLKGGAGSVAFIDLFGPDDSGDIDLIPEELEVLRNDKILVNDAFLTFYVKKDEANNIDPGNFSTRVYLYDATNNTAILDYIFDSSVTASNSQLNKYVYGGILEVDSDGTGVRYRIRLRNHINNIINGTNENSNGNVRLGLSVTQNINNAGMNFTPSSAPGTPSDNYLIPIGSVLKPTGTIIYGNNTTDETKKLKLEIYYTKPN